MVPPARRDGRPSSGRPGTASGKDDRESRGGSRLAPKGPRLPEPRIPEGVTGKELDRSIHGQLRTLSKENADGVAQHLVMVAAFLEADDLESALAHAETAVRRAGRVPAAREALGMVAYRQGDFARALTEFRTVRRLSGSSHLLPLMVDCERGLGRQGRALDLAATPEAAGLEESERIELAIVVSGIRRDLGQEDAALLALQIPALKRSPTAGVFRLHYAYADVLLGLGREDEAREWFVKAMKGDTEGETDAVERLEELDGIALELGEDDELEVPDAPRHPRSRGSDPGRRARQPATTAVVCDLDGVVYRGPTAVPHAVEVLGALERAGALRHEQRLALARRRGRPPARARPGLHPGCRRHQLAGRRLAAGRPAGRRAARCWPWAAPASRPPCGRPGCDRCCPPRPLASGSTPCCRATARR